LWGSVLLLLLVTAGFYPALVVALAWGILLSAHGFFAVLAPQLGRKWTEEEMARLAASQQDNAAARQLAQARQARSLEQLSASIAHEIRNPITAAKSLLQQMAEDPTSSQNVEYAKVAIEELDRVERSVSHLLRYAREEELTLAEIDLAEVAGAALDALEKRVGESPARVERDFDFEATLRMRGDADKLRRVVMNLVDNALDALETGTRTDPFVRVSCGRSLGGGEVWLRVKDNGPGIEPTRLAQIWNPFHTSRERGTGLGLAITRKLVEAHAGSIDVTSDSASGTEFVATFPSIGAA
jgi:signal transduction histidine kinase